MDCFCISPKKKEKTIFAICCRRCHVSTQIRKFKERPNRCVVVVAVVFVVATSNKQNRRKKYLQNHLSYAFISGKVSK